MDMCRGCGSRPIRYKKDQLCAPCYMLFKRTGSFERSRQPRGKCTVEGCEKQAHGKGLCSMHGKRLAIYGTTDDPKIGNKYLPSNQKLYPQWAGYKRINAYPIVPEWKDSFEVFLAAVGDRPSPRHRLYRIDKTQPLGPGNFEWRAGLVQRGENESRDSYEKRHRAARLETYGSGSWDSELKFKYGITLRDLRAMAEAQDHKCAICGQPETRVRHGRVLHLAVDHSHDDTGKIRGLLCGACNTAIGLFKDDVGLLASAIAYLNKHKVLTTS